MVRWFLCLMTAYRRRDREDKWLYTSILPLAQHPILRNLWGLAKSQLPHHMHSTLPVGSVGDPARQVSGTRRQAPTRVSAFVQIVAAGGAGSGALLSRFRDPRRWWCWQSVITGLRNERARVSQSVSQSVVLSRWNPLKPAVFTATACGNGPRKHCGWSLSVVDHSTR